MKGRPTGTRRTARRGVNRGPRTHHGRREVGRGEEQGDQGPQVEGVVSAHRAGYGFVRTDSPLGSVFLPREQMRGILHGDRVRIGVRRDAAGRHTGRVLELLERGVQAFLATVEQAGRGLLVRAADARLGLRCRVLENAAEARAGDWVIARLLRFPGGSQHGEARIERRLDPQRPVQMATEAAIARFALPVEFPAAALREARQWGSTVDAAEAARRTDLRSLPLVTIDGEDARDFDDAVYAEQLAGGSYRLVVAIADVSYYVRPGSALDQEARARGTSVYFPTRVLPMLPTALSNHLCSLEPQVERLCMVADMRVSRRGVLEQSRCYEAVMRSAARLTYAQVHAALFLGERTPLGVPAETLQPLLALYRALRAARARRGALDFDAAEAEFAIEGERIGEVLLRERNEAHRLIEECMVLANVAVAEQLRPRRPAVLYRVHAAPEQKKLEQLSATLRVLGMELKLPEAPQARDLASIAARMRDAHTRQFVETLIVRSMAQALYQPENIGHFGLALKEYTHFTSPIRRYPDLLVHRALRALLGIGAPEAGATAEELPALGAELSNLERRADAADRFVSTFLKCVYLRDRIGQSFDGLITAVVEFGCFVQLLDFGVDGLLGLSALRDDDYRMMAHGGAWLGQHTRRRLAPGVRLRVRVASVKPVEGHIELELTED